MAKHIALDSRVQNLEYAKAFSFLTDQEKNYAYYLTKASWSGVRVLLHQICYEAAPLFVIFQAYFQDKDFSALEEAALKAGVSQAVWKNFIAYVGGFYGNLSNYHNFGNSKFVPELTAEEFKTILYSHPSLNKPHYALKETLDELYPQVEKEVFEYGSPYT